MVECLGCLRGFERKPDPEGQESLEAYCPLCQVRIAAWRQDQMDAGLEDARRFFQEEDAQLVRHKADIARRLKTFDYETARMYRESLMEATPLVWKVVDHQVDANLWPENEREARWIPRKRRGQRWRR